MGPAAPMPNAGPYMQSPAGPTIMEPMSNSYGQPQQTNLGPAGGFNGNMPMQMPMPTTQPAPSYGFAPQQPTHMAPSQPPTYATATGMPQQSPYGGPPAGAPPGAPGMPAGNMGQFPQFGMFQQPIVQDMAMQYGQRLADQGKQMVENQFEKCVPVAKLKYYFSVDNNYVIHKMRLLFFPFTHRVSFECAHR